jgi:hypothetical protein
MESLGLLVYRVYKFATGLYAKTNPFHHLTHCFFKINFNIILLSTSNDV